jgi:beta-lactam-binding protein with PASTA domain
MAEQNNLKHKFKSSFWFNFAVVASLAVLLYVLFFASLHCVTNHGEEVMTPDVRGKKADSAIQLLRAMSFEVEIDSTYEPAMRPLTVLKQVPDTGSLVKRGRTIFLTINMLMPPRVPMPSIKDLSYRSAEMILRNNKLVVGDTSYKADIASGAVLEVYYNGNIITPGTPIPQGSRIDLILGNGLGNTEWDVPNVTGMSVDEALVILSQFNLQPMLVPASQLEQISDTPTAVITDQRPRQYNDAGAKNRIKMGDFIDLQIMQRPAPEDIYQGKQ